MLDEMRALEKERAELKIALRTNEKKIEAIREACEHPDWEVIERYSDWHEHKKYVGMRCTRCHEEKVQRA